jgi:hypothetical protein
MAEKSIFWTTGSTGDGASPYTQTDLIDFFRDMFVGEAFASECVLPGILGEFAVTPGSGKVTVAAGGAYLFGYPYVSTAGVDVTIPTPSANTRIDRVILRADWEARTVRIVRIAGVEGVDAPSIVQVAGTVYDVPLAQVSVTTGGAITITDQRGFVHFSTLVGTINVDDGVIPATKLAGGAVTTEILAANSVGNAEIAPGAVTNVKIPAGAGIPYTKIASVPNHPHDGPSTGGSIARLMPIYASASVGGWCGETVQNPRHVGGVTISCPCRGFMFVEIDAYAQTNYNDRYVNAYLSASGGQKLAGPLVQAHDNQVHAVLRGAQYVPGAGNYTWYLTGYGWADNGADGGDIWGTMNCMFLPCP